MTCWHWYPQSSFTATPAGNTHHGAHQEINPQLYHLLRKCARIRSPLGMIALNMHNSCSMSRSILPRIAARGDVSYIQSVLWPCLAPTLVWLTPIPHPVMSLQNQLTRYLWCFTWPCFVKPLGWKLYYIVTGQRGFHSVFLCHGMWQWFEGESMILG